MEHHQNFCFDFGKQVLKMISLIDSFAYVNLTETMQIYSWEKNFALYFC